MAAMAFWVISYRGQRIGEVRASSRAAAIRAAKRDYDIAHRAGDDPRLFSAQRAAFNPPKGFIPCSAVKITKKNGGGVEVRIKRR